MMNHLPDRPDGVPTKNDADPENSGHQPNAGVMTWAEKLVSVFKWEKEQRLELEPVQVDGEMDVSELNALTGRLRRNDPTLSRMNLRNKGIGNEGAEKIAEALRRNTHLTFLDLERNGIGDDGAKALADALCFNTALAWLDLHNNCIAGGGSEALAGALRRNVSLISLDLGLNSIGDNGAKAVADALRHNSSLARLDLLNNGINWEGAAAVMDALRYNSTLTRLVLTDRGIDVGLENTIICLVEINRDSSSPQEAAERKGVAFESHSPQTPYLRGSRTNGMDRGEPTSGTGSEDFSGEGHGAVLSKKANRQVQQENQEQVESECRFEEQKLVMGKRRTTIDTSNIFSRFWSQVLRGGNELKQLVERVKINDPTLVSVDLWKKGIGDEGVAKLADALCGNTSVASLTLLDNRIGDKGAASIAEALYHNCSLVMLDMTANNIGDFGAKAVAVALRHNKSLTTLDLYDNNIGEEGASALADALLHNTTLTMLGLGMNNVGDAGAKVIADRLCHNATISTLDLRGNGIGNDGAEAVLAALLHNTTISELGFLDNGITADLYDKIKGLVKMNKSSVTEKEATARKMSAITGSNYSLGKFLLHHQLQTLDAKKEFDARGDGKSIRQTAQGDSISEGREIMRVAMSSPDTDPCTIPLKYVKVCTESFSDELRLGEGSYSCVYIGKDRALHLKFAVKRLRVKLHTDLDLEAAKTSFKREIVTLKHFRHPNIARLYAYHLSPELSGDHCLVFELASNGSLYSFLKDRDRREKLHWTKRISIALDITKALEYLHKGRSGEICYHRDVKSENICLKRDFTALLIDCGLAKMIPEDESSATMTLMESTLSGVRGTPGYICPMFARQMKGYSSANDVFSLGVVMAEIFTGMLQNSVANGKEIDMFNRYSNDGIEKRSLIQDADNSAGDWDADVRHAFTCLVVECISLNPSNRPNTTEIVQRLGIMASKARPRTCGERNHITVLSSAPLVYEDAEGKLCPILESPNFVLERDLLVRCITETKRNIRLTFDVATDDRLQVAATRRCGCLHFSGHGHRECLLFEDGTGGAHWLGSEKLYDCVHENGPFQFVFVSACASLHMGIALVKAGVPHVVCCEQDAELRDDAALKFTYAFYFALAEGYTIKAAFEKGKLAISSRFLQEEVDKFMLIPSGKDHDVPLFDAEILEWRDRPTLECFIPPPPTPFIGREIEMYNILQVILSHQLVSLVGEEGVGCSSLASAVCHYVNDRRSVMLDIENIHFIRCTEEEHEKNALVSFIKPLHEQLFAQGRAEFFSNTDGFDVLVRSTIDALRGSKSLVVFDGVDTEDIFLLRFIRCLFGSTNTVKLLLTARKPVVFSSAVAKEYVFSLGPLSVENSAFLFSKICPYTADSLAKQKDLLDKVLRKSAESFVQEIIEGIPAQTIHIALTISREECACFLK